MAATIPTPSTHSRTAPTRPQQEPAISWTRTILTAWSRSGLQRKRRQSHVTSPTSKFGFNVSGSQRSRTQV